MHLDFRIDVTRPELRELEVTAELDLTDDATDRSAWFLPVWTPGSYLVREYARHLGRVDAWDAHTGKPLRCAKVAKNRFQIASAPGVRRVRLTYRVYAHELTVRTADLTAEHAFWNHACVLLWPVDAPDLAARIRIDHPAAWRVVCSLPAEPLADAAGGRDHVASTMLLADGLDAAIDAPCLVGDPITMDWSVDGVPHTIALDGLAGVEPPATLLDDLTRIVAAARSVFGGALPYSRYLFLGLFSADGHGGLEHADSSTLLAARTALATEKGYREFLGLVAHELFHAWNVKRMRPVAFWRYDYERENHSELLWLAEGWTAYYDDLLCRRAGLLGRDEYLAILAKNIDTLRASPGRLRLSLAESSYDAWIRLYRPDENSRNSAQNYYLNGSLAALCLDLFLLRRSGGDRCLDDVVRHLYASTFGEGRGYTRGDVDSALARVGGPEAVALLAELVDGRLDPAFETQFAEFGIRVKSDGSDRPHLGVTFAAGGTQVAAVEADSPAHSGGIAPGDEILAVQDLRVDAARWSDVWRAMARIDRPLEILVARRGVITRCTVVPRRGRGTTALAIDAAATPQQAHLRDRWLDPLGNDVARRPGS